MLEIGKFIFGGVCIYMSKYGGKKVKIGDLDDKLIISNTTADIERIRQTGDKVTLSSKQYSYLENKLSGNAQELPLKENVKLAIAAVLIIMILLAIYVAIRELFLLGLIIFVIVMFFVIMYVEKLHRKHDVQLLNAFKDEKFEIYSYSVVQKLWDKDSAFNTVMSQEQVEPRDQPSFYLECKDFVFEVDEDEYKRIKDSVWVILFSIDVNEIYIGYYKPI